MIYEAFTKVFEDFERVSELVEVNILIEEATDSGILKVSFQDLKSLRSIQFFVTLSDNALHSRPLLNDDSDEEAQVYLTNDEDPQDNYFVYSQCLVIDESHVVLCCVERLQNRGLTVKLHDLKLQQSSEVSLTTKTNGQMVRLSQEESLGHQLNQEFRDMVYRLSFSPVILDEL